MRPHAPFGRLSGRTVATSAWCEHAALLVACGSAHALGWTRVARGGVSPGRAPNPAAGERLVADRDRRRHDTRVHAAGVARSEPEGTAWVGWGRGPRGFVAPVQWVWLPSRCELRIDTAICIHAGAVSPLLGPYHRSGGRDRRASGGYTCTASKASLRLTVRRWCGTHISSRIHMHVWWARNRSLSQRKSQRSGWMRAGAMGRWRGAC